MGNENIDNKNLVGGFAPSIPGLPKAQKNAIDKTAEFGGCDDGIDWQNKKIERHINTPNNVLKDIIAKHIEVGEKLDGYV